MQAGVQSLAVWEASGSFPGVRIVGSDAVSRCPMAAVRPDATAGGMIMRRTVVLFFALLPVVALSAGVTVAKGASTSAGYGESLCQQRAYLCLDPYKSIGENGAYTGPRRADGAVHLQPPGHRRQRTVLRHHAAEEREGDSRSRRAPAAPRTSSGGRRSGSASRMCDTESSPNFTKTCNPTATPTPGSAAPTRSHRITSAGRRQRVHGAAVLQARLGAPVRRLRLQRQEVVRQPDDRQPVRRPQHRRSAERGLPGQPLPGR